MVRANFCRLNSHLNSDWPCEFPPYKKLTNDEKGCKRAIPLRCVHAHFSNFDSVKLNMASKEQSQKTTKTLACFSPQSSSSTSSEKGVEGTILLDDLFSTTCSLFVIKRLHVSFSKKLSTHASEKVLCYGIAYLCQMSKDVFP